MKKKTDNQNNQEPDLTGKCGDCTYFEPIDNTARGWCILQHSIPMPQYPRTRGRCRHFRSATKKQDYQIMQGRRVKLPLIHTVVIYGEEQEYRIDKDDVIKCWRCGTEFTVGQDNVERMPNGMDYVQCRFCGIKINALHAYEDAVKRSYRPVYDAKKSGKVHVYKEKRPYNNANSHRVIDDEKAMEYYNKGCDDYDIAVRLGASKSGVQSWRRRNFLPANREKGWQHTKEETD